MKLEKQQARRRQIEAAAYEVLSKNGYKAASMLAIAKRAGASNETLYNWYGNKQTLFRSLVESNAQEVTQFLQQSIDHEASAQETIRHLGPVLLRMITSEKAILLNRAAAADADETGILGGTLSRAGRNTVAPLIAKIFEQARKRGELAFDDTDDIVDLYLSLLIGDLQIRRVVGACPELSDSKVQDRANRAWHVLQTLFHGG